MPTPSHLVLFSFVEKSAFSMNVPSYQAIQSAVMGITAAGIHGALNGPEATFRPTNTPGNLASLPISAWGGWVGPPRVVRRNSLAGQVETYVTALWSIPASAEPHLNERQLAQISFYFAGALQNISAGFRAGHGYAR